MVSTFTYDHYFAYDELTANLKFLAETHKELVKLYSLNQTAGGRSIWAVEVTDLTTGDYALKAAFYVDGNHHAGEVTGSMCALYFLDYLLTNKDDQEVRELLKKYTFYFIPRVSPDGAECYLTTPMQLRSVDKMYPFDQPMPGLHIADMDNDGVIRFMRVKTPYGVWKVSQEDLRSFTKRRPDEAEGEFYNVYQEGYIENFDGINIQPAPEKYGIDLNRNYPLDWAPENQQQGAGAYPLSNIETKSVADFVIAHKNIGSVITFHTSGGMFLYPPGMKKSREAFKEDMENYKKIGKIATEITGFPTVNLFDEFTPADVRVSSGAFDDWCHYDRGIPAYTVECWDMAVRAGVPHVWPRPSMKTDEDDEADFLKKLKWIDENLGEDAFKPWTKFQHPQLGEVEIGGYDYKYVVQNCPPKFLLQEVQKHTMFMLRNAKVLPQIQIDQFRTEKIGDHVYKITAIFGNRGFLSTSLTREAVKLKVDHTVKASLRGESIAEYISGKETQDLGHLEGFSGIKAGYGFKGISTFPHEPYQKKAEWIVKAEPGSELKLCVEGKTSGYQEETLTLE